MCGGPVPVISQMGQDGTSGRQMRHMPLACGAPGPCNRSFGAPVCICFLSSAFITCRFPFFRCREPRCPPGPSQSVRDTHVHQFSSHSEGTWFLKQGHGVRSCSGWGTPVKLRWVFHSREAQQPLLPWACFKVRNKGAIPPPSFQEKRRISGSSTACRIPSPRPDCGSSGVPCGVPGTWLGELAARAGAQPRPQCPLVVTMDVTAAQA